jgi:DNA-binding transcriptional ArsR family regulator
MVNSQDARLDLAFNALAHPIRRGILARLSTGEASIAELAKPFKVSAPAITKHMKPACCPARRRDASTAAAWRSAA